MDLHDPTTTNPSEQRNQSSAILQQTSSQFQHHLSKSSYSLASQTVSMETPTSPLGNTPEGTSSFGKLTASTSFSGSIRAPSKQPLQDSEDSSYDSDCEVSDATSHNDVSRTVSDTLAQEFEEYVTVSSKVGVSCQRQVLSGASSSDGAQFNPEDPSYKSKLEFAKKLGYTETQVQIVLSKLGPNPSQNELLNELILLDDNSGLNEIISSSSTETSESGVACAPAPSVARVAAACTGSSNLRHIVIDGSNIAMSHGNNKVFSCRGIKLAVEYFKARGHKQITVFVPSYRKESPKPDDPVSDQHILTELEKEGILVYTPSRLLNNRRLICYDDRYILKLAVDVDGIVVSNDNYRDLTIESLDYKRTVEEKLLMYSFVNDRFMPPEDPLGRNGPTLDQFLSKSMITQLPPPCPYGRKCTYGQKCKYYHSTQPKSVSETLRKQAMKTQSVPIALTSSPAPVCRTRSAVVPMESSKDLSIMPSSGANPHRKLQRQLSINPGGDPRIHSSFQRGASLNSSNPSPHHHHLQHHHSLFPSAREQPYSLNPFPGNPTLSEVWRPADWGLSARATTSSGGQDDWVSRSQTNAPVSNSPVSNNPDRTTIYYHLAALFPEHQVKHVMGLYPDCNDPSFICKQITSIFQP